MRKLEWKCKRCDRTGTDGCDMPDYRVPVPYESGVVMERPACPLELKTRRMGLWARIRSVFT